MSKTLAPCILTFLFCVLLPGCGGGTSASLTSDSDSAAEDSEAVADVTADAVAWADSVMAEMSLEQLAGQLVLPAVYSDAGKASMDVVASYAADLHVGGVVLLKGSVEAARAIADTLRSLSAAPPFLAIDAEWGLAMRLKNTPEFPKNGRISPHAEETLLFDYGCEVARECRNAGINMVLGPVLDVIPDSNAVSYRRSLSGIGNRSFGCNPERVARLGVAYARGVESGGVLSVAKHFPGHGAADADSHHSLPVVSKSLDQLQLSDLVPFREYIRNGLSCVMVGHLRVPALDREGLPASVSPQVLRSLLRDKMKFQGIVMTDAMNMAAVNGKSGADAIFAGADIVIAPESTSKELGAILNAVRNGTFPIAELRRKVARILFFKYLMAKDMRAAEAAAPGEAQRLQRELSALPL